MKYMSLVQNMLLRMHNIWLADIDYNLLTTFKYGHFKRFSNHKMLNVIQKSNQGGLTIIFYNYGNSF